MALKLTWSARRQLLYYAVGLVICAVLVGVFYQLFLVRTPSCQDGEQNQNERGVDCGGVCTLVCQADVHQLSVSWARSFEVAPGYYSAAAYVKNDNVTAGAKGVKYSFQLFDDKNLLVVEREGTVNLPPVPTIPIIENNIKVGNRSVARTLFSFITAPLWYSTKAPVLRVSNQELAQDGSAYSAEIINDSLLVVRRATVAVVLFDAAGVAKAASKTTIDIPAKGSQTINFTWPIGAPNIVRAEVTVLAPF